MAREVELDLSWEAETMAAYGVAEEVGGRPLIWLPKSQCEVETGARVGSVASFLVPEWLAIEKGLV